MLLSLNIKDAPPKPDEWDGDWRCYAYSSATGVSEWQMFEELGSKQFIHIRRIQHNVDQMLSANQGEYNDQLNARWGDGKKVASVPTGVWHGLGLETAFQNNDWAKIKSVLNDHDNVKLRTFKGAI